MSEFPKLVIPIDKYRQIMAYVTLADGEITGFTEVEYQPEKNRFIVGDVYLLEQEAQPAEVEMSEEQIGKFMLERIEQGATQLPRLWWHSHVNMAAFFSGTDTDTMAQFKNESYTVSLVLNKEQKVMANLNIWKPFPISTKIDVEVSVLYEEIPEELVQEVKDKVKERHYDFWDKGKKNDQETEEGLPAYDEEKELAVVSNIYDGPTAWLPIDKKEGFEFLTDEQDDLWVSWDYDKNEYTFYHTTERVMYQDVNGDYQAWAARRVKNQAID